jgi:hypothetical protein
MLKDLCIITPLYNNIDEFNITLSSIKPILDNVEFIIVDSSEYFPINDYKEFNFQNYYWVKPKGVYNAFNFAISKCTRKYIMCLNSGDIITKEGINLFIDGAIFKDSLDVFLFSQISFFHNKEILFEPLIESIWPHQSIIYKRELHDKYGLYSEKYKIISDQLFFEKVKNDKKININIYKVPLTKYSVVGISSIMNFNNLKEYKYLNYLRGRSNFTLFFRFIISNLFKLFKLDFNKFWFNLRIIFYKIKSVG